MPKHNINEFDRLYRRKKQGLGKSGSLVRISLKPIKSKTLRVLTHITVENETSDFTKVRFGINNRGISYYLDELQSVVVDELCVGRSDVLLGDGDSFFAELTGTTDNDILMLVASGWEMDI